MAVRVSAPRDRESAGGSAEGHRVPGGGKGANYLFFRHRPADPFFREARRRDVAIIVRVPLASGLLTGKMTRETTFPPEDHRNYHREGRAFDGGETFAEVPFEVGLEAVEALRPLVPPGATMAQFALRWILMFEEVSVVIPGAKSPRQAEDNAGDRISRQVNPNRFAGGSGVLPTGAVDRRIPLIGRIIALALAGVVGLVIWLGYGTGPWTIPLGIIGMIGGFFYSVPPVRWAATGIGEISGPLYQGVGSRHMDDSYAVPPVS